MKRLERNLYFHPKIKKKYKHFKHIQDYYCIIIER